MRARKIKRTVVFLPQPQMRLTISVAACCLSLMLAVQAAEARILRVGAYNTFNNPDNATEDAWFSTIFKAIGNEVINGTAKRLDVLAVSETDTGSSARLASVLNSLYSVSSYSAVTYLPASVGTVRGWSTTPARSRCSARRTSPASGRIPWSAASFAPWAPAATSTFMSMQST